MHSCLQQEKVSPFYHRISIQFILVTFISELKVANLSYYYIFRATNFANQPLIKCLTSAKFSRLQAELLTIESKIFSSSRWYQDFAFDY
jgi:hypothetical protein